MTTTRLNWSGYKATERVMELFNLINECEGEWKSSSQQDFYKDKGERIDNYSKFLLKSYLEFEDFNLDDYVYIAPAVVGDDIFRPSIIEYVFILDDAGIREVYKLYFTQTKSGRQTVDRNKTEKAWYRGKRTEDLYR